MNQEFLEGWKDGVRFSCRILASAEHEHLFLTHKFPLIVVKLIIEAAQKKLTALDLVVNRGDEETYYRAGFCRGVWFVEDEINQHAIAFASDDCQKDAGRVIANECTIRLKLLRKEGK